MPINTEYRVRRRPTNHYEKVTENWKFSADGVLDGDYDWNNCDAKVFITFDNQTDSPYSAVIKPFTSNCGIKAISHLYGYTVHQQEFLEILESFLYYCCNAGIIVGSSYKNDATSKTIKNSKIPYTLSPNVWNPNYHWDYTHKIFTFYKILNPDDLIDYWG